MASICSEAPLGVSVERAWILLRKFGGADKAFPGVLIGCRLEGDSRIVTFASGTQVREQLVDLDDARHRLAYAAVAGRFSHHSASMQVIAEGPERSRFVWISDFLPNEVEPMVRALVQQGTAAFQRAAEGTGVSEARLAGGCSCGAVRYHLGSAPMFVNCCHCRDCQRQTGSAFVLNALIETDRLHLDCGTLQSVAMPTSSGRPHDIYRCPACHIALWSDYGRRAGLRFLRVGTLDDPDALPPDAHIFTRSKLPWVVLPTDRPAYPVYYDLQALWPAASLHRRRSAVEEA